MRLDPWLDIVFEGLHVGLILFTLSGWLFRKTRKLHLAISGLVLASWFILGLWFGMGYCPLTDWHWSIKRRLGQTALPSSYITYLLERIIGPCRDTEFVEYSVLVAGVGAFFVSAALNLKDLRRGGAEGG